MQHVKRWWFIVAVPLTGALVAIIASVTGTYRAFGDQAKIELHARSVFSADTPLTGLVGRFDWNHPGPVMFWLLSPAAMIAGRTSTPLRVEYTVLCGAAIIAALAIAWPLGRRFFTTIALASALSLIGFQAGVITTYWNPSLPVPLLLLLVVLTARVAAGHTRYLIGMVVVGSIMVETHVGTALLVATCGAVAVAWMVLDARRERRLPDRWRSTLVWSSAVAAVLWVLPVVGVVRHVRGNLLFVFSYFRNAPGGHTGLSRAAGIFAAEYAWRPEWLGGPERFAGRGFAGLVPFSATASTWLLLVPATMLATGLVLTVRAGDRRWFRYCLMTALLAVAAILAISRGDQPFVYTFAWRTVIAPLTLLIPMVPIVERVTSSRPRTVITVAAAAAVAVLVASLAAIPHYRRGTAPDPIAQGTVTAMTIALDQQDLDGRSFALRSDPVSPFGAMIYDATVNEMDRRGARVVVSEDPIAKATWGDRRAGSVESADALWRFVATPERFAALRAEPGAKVIWSQYDTFGIIELPVPR